MRELRSHPGRRQPKRIDPQAEKRKSWCDHGQLGVKLDRRRKEPLDD